MVFNWLRRRPKPAPTTTQNIARRRQASLKEDEPRRDDYVVINDPLSLNPLNPLSPFSPFNPLNQVVNSTPAVAESVVEPKHEVQESHGSDNSNYQSSNDSPVSNDTPTYDSTPDTSSSFE